MISILGVAVSPAAAVELYGLNAAQEVTLHGWFDQSAVLTMLRHRPPCLIAIDAGVLPADVIVSLRESGHEVEIVPALTANGLEKRRAEHVCRHVLDLPARASWVATMMHSSLKGIVAAGVWGSAPAIQFICLWGVEL